VYGICICIRNTMKQFLHFKSIKKTIQNHVIKLKTVINSLSLENGRFKMDIKKTKFCIKIKKIYFNPN